MLSSAYTHPLSSVPTTQRRKMLHKASNVLCLEPCAAHIEQLFGGWSAATLVFVVETVRVQDLRKQKWLEVFN